MRLKRITAFLLGLTLLLTGCSSSTKERNLTYTDTLFDTVISVQILDSVDQEVLDGCEELAEKYDKLFDPSNEESDIYKINHAKGSTVEVSDDTARLIEKGLYYSELSDGVYDITIGAVTDLWDFTSGEDKIPSDSRIEAALEHVNYQNVHVDGDTVTLSDSKARLDVGSIAKGYIADRLKEYLKENGVSHALINLGGDVLAVGNKLDGSDFNIGIQEPFADTGEAITAVKVADKAVATSGNYERYFEKNDKIYHHIISTSSGKPAKNSLNSVTIITDSALTADAVSTWCYLLGYKKALKTVDQLDNVDAVFINKDNELLYSANFQRN